MTAELVSNRIPIALPIVISREDKWFIATCPPLKLVTQGVSEIEVKENMKDLLEDYFSDPDTPKPRLDTLMDIELSQIPIYIPEGVVSREA